MLLSVFLQIDWSDLRYTVDDLSRTVYSFPVHIRVLLAVTLIFILVILILLGVVLSSRIYKTGHVIKRELIRGKYEKIFRQLLFDDRVSGSGITGMFDKADLDDSFVRDIIKAEIIHLHENFTGEAAERLEEIYSELKFNYDSLRKLKNKRWYIVAKGLRELALMNVKNALPVISGFINNRNEILRMEARIAIMKLSESNPLSFLSIETAPLSGWDTANIYSMLSKMPEKMIPAFATWLNSTNKDVVLFCIQMIGTFRQSESAALLIQLLRSDDERIKLACIKALRSLNATPAEAALIGMYENEILSIRIEILRTLEVIGTSQSASFLEKILQKPFEDYPLVIQAVRSLLALGNIGNTIIDRMIHQSGAQMELVINHAKDKRL